MVISMIIDEFLLKWIKNKKNLYGLVGFTIIMMILAADFAFWAGEITINAAVAHGPDGETDSEEEPWMYQLDVDDSHSGTLIAPSPLGAIRIEGLQYVRHDFEVKENATLGFVNVSVSGTKLRPDFDMVVFDPHGEVVVESKTEAAEEHIEIDYKVFNRTDPGIWYVEVENYSSFAIDYELTIQIHIRAPIEDAEKKEGD